VIVRAAHYGLWAGAPLLQPLFLGIAALLGSISVLLVALLPEDESDWGMMLCLLLCLLVYPSVGASYGVILILPIVFMWQHRQDMPGGAWMSILFIALEYALFNKLDWPDHAFYSFLLCWLMVTVICAQRVLQRRLSTFKRPQNG